MLWSKPPGLIFRRSCQSTFATRKSLWCSVIFVPFGAIDAFLYHEVHLNLYDFPTLFPAILNINDLQGQTFRHDI